MNIKPGKSPAPANSGGGVKHLNPNSEADQRGSLALATIAAGILACLSRNHAGTHRRKPRKQRQTEAKAGFVGQSTKAPNGERCANCQDAIPSRFRLLFSLFAPVPIALFRLRAAASSPAEKTCMRLLVGNHASRCASRPPFPSGRLPPSTSGRDA